MCRKFKLECNSHSGPKPTEYNVGHQHWDNIHTILPEHCVNVGPQCWAPTLRWHSHNIAWMLCEHWSPTSGTDVQTTFTQHCLNVVSMSVPTVESNIATTFTQHCLNIVSMSFSNIGSDVATKYTQCYLNVEWTMSTDIMTMLGFSSKYNVGTMFTQHCLDVHTTLLGHLKVSTFERCHNVGTNVVTMLPTLPHRWSISRDHNYFKARDHCHVYSIIPCGISSVVLKGSPNIILIFISIKVH